MKIYHPSLAVLCAALLLSSCSKSENPTQSVNSSSFQKLQEKILTKTCVQCHTAGADYANESGLVLDADVAYANLVGVPAHHSNALIDGLLRVKAGSADSSFLYMKVHAIPQGKIYGSNMPLGLTRLSIGQQEFIRQWINAGAPKTGTVADAALLDDTTHYAAADFTPLEPPAPGTGYQITTGKFDVPANFEREIFVYRRIGNTQPIFINHIHTKMRPNSHHLVLYTFDPTMPKSILPKYDIFRDLRNPDGSYIISTQDQMNYHFFLGGSMVQEEDYWFPPGVALPLAANSGIDFNTHFINRTTNTIPGECYANIYTVNPANIQHVAQPIFDYTTAIDLPPNQQTIVTNTSLNQTGAPINIFMLTSHNHEWGKKFQIAIAGGSRNGEIVYESTDWAHPLVKTFNTPIVLNNGEGLKYTITYFNNTTRTINFGLTSQDEMAVIYGYYY